jgi:hypothetical protein
MKGKIITAIAMVVAIASFGSPVNAQSSDAVNSSTEKYTITGDSLTGIDNRSAEDDFGKFFEINTVETTPNNNVGQKVTPVGFRINESLSMPDTPIYLQPAESFNGGNDGVQVQLDLRE